MTDRKGSNGASQMARQNEGTVENAATGAPKALAVADAHDSLVYILALLKPLADIAKTQNLDFLTFLLEMSVLEAAELESKYKRARAEQSASV